MKSIQTKILGPTNTKPFRIKVSAEGVASRTWSRDYFEGNTEQVHKRAAQKFCEGLDWPTTLASGGTVDPCVWVHCFIPRDLIEASRNVVLRAKCGDLPGALRNLENVLNNI